MVFFGGFVCVEDGGECGGVRWCGVQRGRAVVRRRPPVHPSCSSADPSIEVSDCAKLLQSRAGTAPFRTARPPGGAEFAEAETAPFVCFVLLLLPPGRCQEGVLRRGKRFFVRFTLWRLSKSFFRDTKCDKKRQILNLPDTDSQLPGRGQVVGSGHFKGPA